MKNNPLIKALKMEHDRSDEEKFYPKPTTNPKPQPRLTLLCFNKKGKEVARADITIVPLDKLKATLEIQKMLGRTFAFKIDD